MDLEVSIEAYEMSKIACQNLFIEEVGWLCSMGLNQKAIALGIGITEVWLSTLMKRKAEPTLKTLRAFISYRKALASRYHR